MSTTTKFSFDNTAVDEDIQMVANWKKVGDKGSWRGYIQFTKEDNADSRFNQIDDEPELEPQLEPDTELDTQTYSWYNPLYWMGY